MYIGITLIVTGLLGLAIIAYSLTKDGDTKDSENRSKLDKPVDPTPTDPIPKAKVEELDIPQRALNALEEFEFVEELRKVEDLTSIDGIGDSYAEDIREALDEE
jgi:predicted flap endonuclease-1-like 5' DNA nuclease